MHGAAQMSRTATYLSLLNFNTALFYARSMRHDVKAIRNAVLRAGQFVHSYVGCLHDEKVTRAFRNMFNASTSLHCSELSQTRASFPRHFLFCD
jgi:hypothetical protein